MMIFDFQVGLPEGISIHASLTGQKDQQFIYYTIHAHTNLDSEVCHACVATIPAFVPAKTLVRPQPSNGILADILWVSYESVVRGLNIS